MQKACLIVYTGDGAQAAAPMTFNFGVPPMAAPSQAASPPWAIPAATGATGSQDGNGSLVRTVPALLSHCVHRVLPLANGLWMVSTLGQW